MSSTFFSTRSRLIAAHPDDVLAVVRDASSWPEWQPEIRSASGSSELEKDDVVRGDADMLGFEVRGHSTITEVGDGRFEEDVVVGVNLHIAFSFEPSSNGTRVTHRMTTQLPTGMMGRLLSVFLRRRLIHMQRTALDRLARHAEASAS